MSKTIRNPVFCMLFSYFYYYGVRGYLTKESRKRTYCLDSQFKDAVDAGRREKQMVTLHLQSGSRGMNVNPRLTSTFKIIKSLLVEWHHPHFGRGFSL